MSGPHKRIWKRILITIDSDSSDDEGPPSKVNKTQDVKNAPETTASKYESTVVLRDKTDDDHSQVVKKRRLDVSAPCAIPNSISAACYQQVICNITSINLQENISGLLQLSVLSFLSVKRKLIMRYNKSDEYLKYSFTWLLETLEGSRQKNICLVNSSTAIVSMVKMSGTALWASFISVTNLIWLDPQTDLFVAAVQSVVRIFQSQVMALHSASRQLDKVLVPDSVKRGVEAVYETMINLTFLLNSLLMKKKFMMKDFVLLTIDIAMLPLFRSDRRKLHRLLYLVRTVLKSQYGSWDKCTTKIFFEMCHFKASNKNILVSLESGSQVHKCTLLLLTLIQSSHELPVPQKWVETGTCYFSKILSTKDIKYILGEPIQDMEDQSCKQETESRSVLENADFIIRFFYDQVMSIPLEKTNQCAEHFESFLQDLLTLMEDFQWPAAEYVLMSLCNFMVTSLKEDELPKTSCKFVTECLTAILLKFVHLILSLETEDPKNLAFLQRALFAYLARQCRDNGISQDRCLFYLAVWQTDLSAEEWGNKAQFFKQANCWESKFVNRDNIRDVVNCITGLRRISDIKAIFHKVVLLKNSNDRFLSRNVMTLVVRVFESNSKLFLEEPLLVAIISSRNKGDLIEQRKILIRCLIAYLLHRPDQLNSFYEILSSYISDKEACIVRNTVVKGMKRIGLKFYNDPKILRKLVLLLRRDGDYTDSAAQYFCKITWLEPVKDTDENGLLENKVSLLVDMFALIIDTNQVEEMFPLLFRLECKRSGQTLKKQQLKACAQIVDELSRRCLEKKLPQDSKMVASFKLLNFFAKITPRPLVSRCIPLFRRLGHLCQTITPNLEFTSATTKALETVLSCGRIESPVFLFSIFIDSFKVSNIFNKNTIVSGLSTGCLAARLQRDDSTLQNYSRLSFANMEMLDTSSHDSPEQNRLVQRQLFMFGIILKFLEDDKDYKLLVEIAREVILVESDNFDKELAQTAIFFLGSACLLHPRLILEKNVKDIYLKMLSYDVPTLVLLQVLRNICELLRSLLECTARTKHREPKCLTHPLRRQSVESVKDTGRKLVIAVAETYFKAAIDRYLHPDVLVRLAVLELLIAGQSEVVSCEQVIPLLVAMACDPAKCISDRARKRLAKHAEIHEGCVWGSLETALSLICCLGVTVTDISSPIEGYTIDSDGTGVAKISVLNSITIKSARDNLKIIPLIMEKFDPNRETCIFELLYCAGNVAHFVYPKRRDIVSIVCQIKSMVRSMSNVIESLDQVLHRRTSKLNVHKKRIGNALRLLLLLEMRSFLMKMYRIQNVEVSSLELEQSYRIQITLKERTCWVSDRSKGSCISKEDSTKKFCPTIMTEMAIKSRFCCGRNFSAETLERLFRQLRKLWKKSHKD